LPTPSSASSRTRSRAPGGAQPAGWRAALVRTKPRPAAWSRAAAEAVAPEGHRSRPPGHDPRSAVEGRRRGLRSAPEQYGFKVPNKVVKLAMRSALSAKVAEGVLYVVEASASRSRPPSSRRGVLTAIGHRKGGDRRCCQRRREHAAVVPQHAEAGPRHHRV
jgi:hypothetical protein